MAYSAPKMIRPSDSPMIRKIQPSGLPGQWVAITAPTSGNDIAHLGRYQPAVTAFELRLLA